MIKTKHCPKCRKVKDISCFAKDIARQDGVQSWCKDCRTLMYQQNKEYFKQVSRDIYQKDIVRQRNNHKKWYQSNRGRHVLSCKKHYKKQRMKILVHYGGIIPKCSCCGENHIEFLAIDHLNNDGCKHRKFISGNSNSLHSWIINNDFPPIFQILCHNCNMAKGFYGSCPHQQENK